jgi:Zn2+/Cd2+-exporting ATPase
MSQTVQISLALVLPTVDAADRCIDRLTEWLRERKGVEHAHITRDNGTAELCVHFDPRIVSLEQVERLATEAGASFGDRYRHEQLPFTGLDAADAADTVTQTLEHLPGVLHANVNYAAGLAFVAYDSTMLDRATIEQTLRGMGVRLRPSPAPAMPTPASAVQPGKASVEAGLTASSGGAADTATADEHSGHDHGSAPTFLPHWMQERWTLILVALAGLFLLVGWAGETFFGMSAQIALVFYILAYIAGGYDIATHAIPGLFRGKFDTDVLMLAAATGAAILGEWQEGAFLLFLFALGHAGEHYALDRARNAVNALGQLMPQTARVKRGDQIVETPVAEVQVDDIVVVRPGDRMPVDGTVANGTSAVDQSPITGESVPVTKQPGEQVFAGTINQDAALDVQVTRLAQDNTLSRVMKLVAEAQSQQSPTQQLTQRFTRWFVPSVLVGAVLVTAIPPLLGWMSLSDSFYRAMLLLVAASPCALALGTPATVLAGIAQAARNGVLIKGGVHLENLGSLKVIALDKTGTLTEGRFAVTDVVPVAGTNADELLRIAAAVEQQSNHPLAQALVREAQQRKLTLPAAGSLENVPGRGVRSSVDGQTVLIGSLKLFRETTGHVTDSGLETTVERLETNGRSTMAVSQGGPFLGVLGLADAPREGVQSVLARLRSLGIERLVMLTGDNDDVAQRIGKQLGVTDVRAELLPEDKLTAVKQLQEESGALAMVGDGVNDAPALATATVGIAMGGAGTAVALETADVALMGDNLHKLPFAVGLSRASRAIIRQNLAVSLGVIALLLATSVIGLVQLSWAVVLHEGSTIVVVLNALRLLAFRDANGVRDGS